MLSLRRHINFEHINFLKVGTTLGAFRGFAPISGTTRMTLSGRLAGQQIQASVQLACEEDTEVQGHNLRLPHETGSRRTGSTRTTKPGQAAQAPRVVIFFSLTEALSPTPPRPHPTPRNGPETKQTRNRTKRSQTDRNGAKRS